MMNHKKTVFLPIEIGTRDFDSRLLLGLYLQNKGYACVLVDDKVLNQSLSHIPSSILFDKSFTDIINRARLEPACKNNWFVSGIDEEGYHTAKDNRTLARFSDEAANNIDAAFFWSAQHKQEVISFTENMSWKKKGFATGSQRFDLMTPQGRQYYERIYGNLSMMYGDYVLHNTSFGCNSNKSLELRLQISISNGEIKNHHEKQAFIEKLEFDKSVMNDYLSMIVEHSKESKSSIIVRPHPAERFSFYTEYFGDNSNVRVIRSGPVEPWLFGCKAVIAHHCTTLLQASIFNIPAYNYSRNHDSESSVPLHYRGRATALLDRFKPSTKLDNYCIPKPFNEFLHQLWSLPTSTTNSSNIADILDEQINLSPKVKKISTSSLVNYFMQINTSANINPKIDQSVFANQLKKLSAMAEAYGLNAPSLIVEFERIGILFA